MFLSQLYPEQVSSLLDAFKNPPQTREDGLYFDDKQYRCVRADKNSIYAKYVSNRYCNVGVVYCVLAVEILLPGTCTIIKHKTKIFIIKGVTK